LPNFAQSISDVGTTITGDLKSRDIYGIGSKNYGLEKNKYTAECSERDSDNSDFQLIQLSNTPIEFLLNREDLTLS
jgi:hypothetical protein